MKNILGPAAAVALTVFLSAGGAKATTYVEFTITGSLVGPSETYTFEVPLSPTPDNYNLGSSFELYNIPISTNGTTYTNSSDHFFFYNLASGGGLFDYVDNSGGATVGFGNLGIADPNHLASATQFYSGSESAPTFLIGSYPNQYDGGCGCYFNVSIEPIDTTPLPAALPLFATGLGALGLLGWRRKRKAALLLN